MTFNEGEKKISVEIGELVEADIAQVVPILYQHVRNRFTDEPEEKEIADIQRYMRGGLDEYKRVRKYLVAKSADGLVLGCMAYSCPDADMVRHLNIPDDGKTVELLNAFVTNEVFRGGGVGQKLFEAICSRARAEGKTMLAINSGPRYRLSWGFYDKMGGVRAGLILGKYGQVGVSDAMTWRVKL